MYVSKLKLRNWRNFTEAEVNFRETTYLIGPNASGKSNFLDIFRFMRDICNPGGGGLQHAVSSRGGMKKVRSLSARKKPQIEFHFELVDNIKDDPDDIDLGVPKWTYILTIDAEGKGKNTRPVVAREEIHEYGEKILERPNKHDKKDPLLLTQTHLEQISTNNAFREIAEFFNEVLYLHLVPQLLKHSDQLALNHLEDDPFGQGLLDAISEADKRVQKSRLRRIEDILLKLIPNLEQLEFVKDEKSGRPHLEMLYKHWRPNGAKQREDQFSDGTLRLISMLWTLLTSKSVILLEEPELSLHEAVVKQIPTLIRKVHATRKKVESQIIVSTHSATMLSDTSVDANFLMLQPGEGGEATKILPPSDDDLAAMQAGLSAADILLPQTAASVKNI